MPLWIRDYAPRPDGKGRLGDLACDAIEKLAVAKFGKLPLDDFLPGMPMDKSTYTYALLTTFIGGCPSGDEDGEVVTAILDGDGPVLDLTNPDLYMQDIEKSTPIFLIPASPARPLGPKANGTVKDVSGQSCARGIPKFPLVRLKPAHFEGSNMSEYSSVVPGLELQLLNEHGVGNGPRTGTVNPATIVFWTRFIASLPAAKLDIFLTTEEYWVNIILEAVKIALAACPDPSPDRLEQFRNYFCQAATPVTDTPLEDLMAFSGMSQLDAIHCLTHEWLLMASCVLEAFNTRYDENRARVRRRNGGGK